MKIDRRVVSHNTFRRDDKTCHVFYFVEYSIVDGKLQQLPSYFVIHGWNPLPVKGKFQSSQSVLFAWLEGNGWVKQQGDSVKVIEHHYSENPMNVG